MKALTFQTNLQQNALAVPPEILRQIETNPQKAYQVIVLLDEDADDAGVQNSITHQFFNGYADSDSIYDNV